MTQLKRIPSTALEQTAVLWKPIATAFDWVHQVATWLDNDAQLDAQDLRSSLEPSLQTMERCKDQTGSLASGIDHFLKVTLSYAPGLFHGYDIEGLPRANNDLEQLFGRWRHYQRRCTGRKVAPASLVVRGSVRIVAAIATQMRSFTADDLATVDLAAWQSVRADLKRHQHKRNQQRRSRRSPSTYLTDLEQQFLQLALLS